MAALACGAADAALLNPDEFHRALYSLHETQLAGHEVRTEVVEADYEGSSGEGYRYRETRYFDAKDGRFLSRVRTDARSSDAILIVEVNVYDEAGKLVRDFASASMPWKPGWPVNIFINLHHYAGDLHSYRQFDTDGEARYQSCEGKLDGKKVRLLLYPDDIGPVVRATPEYKACFDGSNGDWKSYAQMPH